MNTLLRMRWLLLASLWFAPMRCMQGAVASDQENVLAKPAVSQAAAVEKGLALLLRGAREYPEHRQCFACHHQTLSLLALKEARLLPNPGDQTAVQEIREFVLANFREKTEDYRQGTGIGGKGLTVGYSLWTLHLADHQPDELTSAMVTFLLKTQRENGTWELHSIRPPAEESEAMITVLAAAGLRRFAQADQREAADRAIQKSQQWLDQFESVVHEDRVARLWSVSLLGGDEKKKRTAIQSLLTTQRPDGGWRQKDDLESDAYATATALYVLLEAGKKVTDSEFARGVAFLRNSQKEDGSWHVVTRAKPVQVFFDNGDPHGKDQFISMMATGWATAVLARCEKK